MTLDFMTVSQQHTFSVHWDFGLFPASDMLHYTLWWVLGRGCELQLLISQEIEAVLYSKLCA